MLTRDQMETHLTLQGWVPGVLWGAVGVHHNRIGFVFMDSRLNSKTFGAMLRHPVHAVKPASWEASWEQIEDWRLASIFAHLERGPYGDA